ncbi:MAG: type VI secretion system tip protein VgrG [bacterium]|nr:type VI secretion system tip protein VgrG [bacterium]
MSGHSRIAIVDIPSNRVAYAFIPGGVGPLEMLTREAGRLVAMSSDSSGNAVERDAYQVTRFELRDTLSDLGGLEVEFLVSDSQEDSSGGGGPRTADPVVDTLLGQPVLFAWACGTEEERSWRYHHGIVTALGEIGGDVGAAIYRATVMPRVWRTTLRANCRIFQGDSTLDIIKTVLGEHDLEESTDAVFEGCQTKYPDRLYCVQYRESDFDFISRLMEEEGIAYAFDHTEERDVIRFYDNKSDHVPCQPYDAVTVLQPQEDAAEPVTGDAHEETVDRLNFNHAVLPGRVRLRDYEFENSQKKPSGTASGLCEEEPEVYDYPGGFQQDTDGKRYANVRQEEIDVLSQVAHGESNFRSLTAGKTFKIVDHPRDSLRQVYLCTSATHTGTDEGVVDAEGRVVGHGGTTFENSFECIPAKVQYRPARVRPKPVIVGVQTARVVGPENEEIYSDKFMRVRVKFHWDLDPEEHEEASGWIRVVQPWADSGFGTCIIPRVGTEVLVEFEEGDPDRPIINGALYNDQHLPAVELPKCQMQSGFKSQSTPGGGGSNEMTMDDTKGKEKVTIHAQYDMSTTVEHDDTQTVVSGNRTSAVQTGTSSDTVKGDTSYTVESGNRTLTVAAGTNSETVQGDSSHTVQAGSRSVSVTGGDYSATASDAVSLHGQSTGVQITGNSAGVTVDGDGAGVVITGDPNFDANGTSTIKLSSPDIDIGDTKIKIHGTEIELSTPGGSIKIDSAGVTITGNIINSSATGIHEITGATVKIN